MTKQAEVGCTGCLTLLVLAIVVIVVSGAFLGAVMRIADAVRAL